MEPELNPTKPINGMLKFFLFCGLWPAQSAQYKWIYCIYATVFHFIFTFGYTYFKVVNLFVETDLRLLTVGFFIFLAEISLIARIINLIVNFDDVLKCLNMVKAIQICDKNEYQIFHKNLSLFSNVMSFYISCGTSACLCSWGAALFSSEPMLPYPAWYPLDWKTNSRSYWIVFTFQVVGVSFQAYSIILLQLFSIYLMVIIGAQFDVLKYRMENLGLFTTLGRKDDQETEFKFIECIKLHQEVIRMVKIVEKLFTVPFFVQFVTSSILFCFTAFKIAIMNISEEIVSFVFYISFSGVFLNEIFLACYFGNEIILKHQNLSIAIYSSEWLSEPTGYRKLIVMVLEMLNTPIVIKTGKLFSLTLNSFLTVINRSYSLFAVLQNTLSR